MTPLILVLSAVVIGACEGARLKTEGLEENENLIEPPIDPWHIFNKPKGKSTLKNVIQAFQAFDSRKKMGNRKNLIAPNSISTTSTEKISYLESSTPLIQDPIKKDNLDKTNYKVSFHDSPSYMSYTKLPLSLHQHTEESKKFIHSIVDGWSF